MINCQFSLCSCERFSESENLNELSLYLRIIWQFSLTSHDTQLKINYFRLVCHLYGQLLVAALNAVRWNCTKMLNYEFDAWALGTGGREQNDFSVLAPKWCHKPIEWNRIPARLHWLEAERGGQCSLDACEKCECNHMHNFRNLCDSRIANMRYALRHIH